MIVAVQYLTGRFDALPEVDMPLEAPSLAPRGGRSRRCRFAAVFASGPWRAVAAATWWFPMLFRASALSPPAAPVRDTGPASYVYDLVRGASHVPSGLPGLLFVLLSPSPVPTPAVPATLRRCDRLAASLGFRGCRVAHLFGYPAAAPGQLVAADRAGIDVVGPGADGALRARAALACRVVVAWGSFREAAVRRLVMPRARRVAAALADVATVPLECFGAGPDGAPVHPLFVRKGAVPRPWPAVSLVSSRAASSVAPRRPAGVAASAAVSPPAAQSAAPSPPPVPPVAPVQASRPRELRVGKAGYRLRLDAADPGDRRHLPSRAVERAVLLPLL